MTPARAAALEIFKNSRTGKTASAETRAKMSAAMTGRMGTPWTEERKMEMSKKMRGRKMPIEAVNKIVAYWTGRPKSAEHRAKIAATLTGRKQSPELIEKRIGPLRGRKKTLRAEPLLFPA